MKNMYKYPGASRKRPLRRDIEHTAITDPIAEPEPEPEPPVPAPTATAHTATALKPLAVYQRLLGYTRTYWKRFAVGIAAMALFSAMEASFVLLMKFITDQGVVDRSSQSIRLAALALVILAFVRAAANYLSNYSVAWVGRRVVEDIRGQLFKHMLRLSSTFYDNNSPGHLLTRLVYSVEQVAQASTNAVIIVVKDGLTIIFLLASMIYLNAILAIVLLVAGPLVALMVLRINKRFREMGSRIQNAVGNVTHVSEQAITAHRVVKIFGGQDHENEQFKLANSTNRRLNIKMISLSASSTAVIQFILACAIALVLVLMSFESILEITTAGTYLAFIIAMALLMGPSKRVTSINAAIQRGIAAARHIFSLLDSETEIDTGSQVLARALGKIEYSHVSFTYTPEKGDVLRDINFAVEPGQTIAVVGRSGSGKSTLVSLLPRFHNPGSGSIFIDGHDIRDLTLDSLRRQIALVSQDIMLFDDTIANNIAYGRLAGASEQNIIEAAEAAHAMEFIRELPQGMDTLIGTNGVMLSGGQRQRLAIARALLKDAPILILDEATASLDSESERYIQAGLERLMQKRTTLVIAHRLSTIERADLIIVLHQGRIIEMGKHKDLLAQGGHYTALHKMQFADVAE
jgi:subfamily B ATP-binding cassette protein MsbA